MRYEMIVNGFLVELDQDAFGWTLRVQGEFYGSFTSEENALSAVPTIIENLKRAA